jgi:hypothetical protein
MLVFQVYALLLQELQRFLLFPETPVPVFCFFLIKLILLLARSHLLAESASSP